MDDNHVIVDEGGTGSGFAIRINAAELQLSVRSENTELAILKERQRLKNLDGLNQSPFIQKVEGTCLAFPLDEPGTMC